LVGLFYLNANHFRFFPGSWGRGKGGEKRRNSEEEGGKKGRTDDLVPYLGGASGNYPKAGVFFAGRGGGKGGKKPQEGGKRGGSTLTFCEVFGPFSRGGEREKGKRKKRT